MKKMQGKVKSERLYWLGSQYVTEGIQVFAPKHGQTVGGIGKLLKSERTSEEWKFVNDTGSIYLKDLGISFKSNNINNLKVLVVEYEYGDSIRKTTLKYSQWQAAINNGEVDSDKEVEFEIIGRGGMNVDNGVLPTIQIAKIIPAKKEPKTYTSLQVEDFMDKYACYCISMINNRGEVRSPADWLKAKNL